MSKNPYGEETHFSGPNLDPWTKTENNEENWQFFGVGGSRRLAISGLHDFVGSKRAEASLVLIGPWKVGKTSTVNYAMKNPPTKKDSPEKLTPVQVTIERENKANRADLGGLLSKRIVRSFIEIAQMMASESPQKEDWSRFIQVTEQVYLPEESKETDSSMLTRLLAYYQNRAVGKQVQKNLVAQADLVPHEKLRSLWDVLALHLGIGDAGHTLEQATNMAGTSPQGAIELFAQSWVNLQSHPSLPKGIVLVFHEESPEIKEGQLGQFVHDVLSSVSKQYLTESGEWRIKFVFEAREPYLGPERRRKTQSKRTSRGAGFKIRAEKADADQMKNAASERRIYLDAFTPEEAEALLTGNLYGVKEDKCPSILLRYKPESIFRQIGYHPGLLQIVCWELLVKKCRHTGGIDADSGICKECLERCLDEIYQRVKETNLLTEEQQAIANNVFDPRIEDCLRGKGLFYAPNEQRQPALNTNTHHENSQANKEGGEQSDLA